MSLYPKWAAIASLLVMARVFEPHRLAAQDLTYFHALAIPPRSVGTCIPGTPRKSGDSRLTKYQLVMTSRTPNRRREISVSVDTAGRAAVYSDLGFASTSLLSTAGDDIVATINVSGRVRGWRTRSTTVMSDSGRLRLDKARLDTARLRTMKENAVTTSSREPLDAESQRRVLEMVEWLRKRCPVEG
jgi:hypothetical protein